MSVGPSTSSTSHRLPAGVEPRDLHQVFEKLTEPRHIPHEELNRSSELCRDLVQLVPDEGGLAADKSCRRGA